MAITEITIMALPTTPRLDNLAAMQTRPLGTNTALYRDPSTEAMTRQYRQQKSDYDMARRLLRRQARRGDSGSALKLIELGGGKPADVPFGMESPDQRGATVARRVGNMQQGVRDTNQAAGTMRSGFGLTPQTPRLDAMDSFGQTPTNTTGSNLTPRTPRLDAMENPELKRKSSLTEWWNKSRK